MHDANPEVPNFLILRVGPEIADFGDPNGPLLPLNAWESVGGLTPSCPMGFEDAGGRLDPPKSTI